MADYPRTGSILDSGRSRTGLSTQIIVFANNEPVGAIQSFQESQSRSNKKVAEVGTDGHIEIVPQSPVGITLSVTRIAFDGLSITEAFSRGWRNLTSQRIPFDIVVIDSFAGEGFEEAIVTTYHNCWFTSTSRTFSSDNYIISEQCGMDCEYVSTTRGGESIANSSVELGRDISASQQRDAVEAAADSGKRRGALDFPGIINAAY
jgi:hypothetical protein